MNSATFSPRLIQWYEEHKRDLPWRNSNDPYLIWISEIILQQTRVDQGISYFHKFLDRFPNVTSLSLAEEKEVLAVWQGLGYYSRARNLHAASKQLAKNGGQFPNSYEKILALPGIGPYTAAAISSFAFDLAHVVVDGNVIRLITRLYGIDAPVNTSVVKKEIESRAQELMDDKLAAIFNQALMEFGALQCKVSSPLCQNCPFNTECQAYLMNSIDKIPFKNKKIKKRKRYFNYLVFRNEEHIVLKKRTKNDIWKNLYDFPLLENEEMVLKEAFPNYFLKGKENKVWIKHVLSHQDIYARFIEMSLDNNSFLLEDDWLLIPIEKLSSYPIPKLIDNYLNEH